MVRFVELDVGVIEHANDVSVLLGNATSRVQSLWFYSFICPLR
jgi:hypothetical protein